MATADVNKVTRMRLKCGRNPRVRLRDTPAGTSICERNVCSRKAITCSRIIEFLSKHASRTSNSRTLSWKKESYVRERGKRQRKEGSRGAREEKMSHGACAAVPPMLFCFPFLFFPLILFRRVILKRRAFGAPDDESYQLN